MKRRLWLPLPLMPVLAWVVPAHAHAVLDHAIPAAGSAVRESPAQLSLWFSDRIEPAFSRVEVLDAAGRRVETGDAQLDRADLKRLQVALPTLAPGRYRVAWRVLSVDTHVAKGNFTFDIAP